MSDARHIEVLTRGVCIRDNRVLLCQTKGSANTYLPGGHIEFDEPAQIALRREIKEELGVEATVGRFLGAIEHSFVQQGSQHCEINLIFQMSVADEIGSERLTQSCEDYIQFLWCPLNQLASSVLEPASLRQHLQDWLIRAGEAAPWASTYPDDTSAA